jgi:peptidoglycan/xylan/chitin deacetylase (PgdA/CDA1 family)
MPSYFSHYYRLLKSRLPRSISVLLEDVAFAAKGQPRVYVDPTSPVTDRFTCGSVTFSIDFEMAWAWRFSKRQGKDAVALGLHEREQVPKILSALLAYDVPATWATVGHLFLDKCSRSADGLAHADLPRAPHFENEWWDFSKGDWFQHDPCTNVRRDPAWYAPDLIESILHCPTQQELACHSFSHVGFGAYCSPEVASAELDSSIEAMGRFGLKPSSLVFPGNEWGNFDVVASKGIRTVRWFPIKWAEITLPLRRQEGLWALHESDFLQVGWEKDAWVLDSHLRRLQRYVLKAAKTKMNAHFWFHPSLLTEQMERILIPLLRFCADAREKGLVEILTMEMLGDRMDSGGAGGGAK